MENLDLIVTAFVHWQWWAITGVIFVILEVFIPGAVFLWPGLAALSVAILAVLFHPSWQFNLLAFALSSVIFAWWGRRAYMNKFSQTDQPLLNQRGNQLIGHQCTLLEETTVESGSAKVGDGVWLAKTNSEQESIAAGTRVKIIAIEGTTLIVTTTPIKR